MHSNVSCVYMLDKHATKIRILLLQLLNQSEGNMSIRHFIIEPPKKMTKESVHEAAEKLFAALHEADATNTDAEAPDASAQQASPGQAEIPAIDQSEQSDPPDDAEEDDADKAD